jgi:type II restriction enzyme
MQTKFNIELASKYTSPSQKVRVLSENWVQSQVYCPNCGYLSIVKYDNGRPVADFYCPNCGEDYELKSKKTAFGVKIVDGAYSTMIERLRANHNPNLFLLNYNLNTFEVLNLLVVPKHFFIPNIIEQRPPLSQTARRAGWTGCNIILGGIPQSGRIYLIKNRLVEPKDAVLAGWQKTLFLRDEKNQTAKGWLMDIMGCIEQLIRPEFKLADMDKFVPELSEKYPNNRHIKAKIRQQLQILRDNGYLEFTSRGNYRLTQNYGN